MLEIAQLLESALAHNQTGLRQAAAQSLSRMAPEMTVRELLASQPGDAIRTLTLSELGAALTSMVRPSAGRRMLVDSSKRAIPQSSEEQTYRQILEVLAEGPQTIGQLGKAVDIETAELRGYLAWMKRMGKIASSGRARATRYAAV